MHLLWATSFIRDFKLYDLKYHLDMRCCYQGYYAAIPSTKAQRQGKGWNNHTYIWSNSPVAGYVKGHNFCSLWRGTIINNWSKFGRSSVQGCLHLWTSSSKYPTQAILKSQVQGPKSKFKQANMTLIKEYSGKPFTNWPSYKASYSRFPLARFDSGLTTKTRKDTMTSEYLKGSTYLLDRVYCISWLPSGCLSSVHLSIPLIPKWTCIYNLNIS